MLGAVSAGIIFIFILVALFIALVLYIISIILFIRRKKRKKAGKEITRKSLIAIMVLTVVATMSILPYMAMRVIVFYNIYENNTGVMTSFKISEDSNVDIIPESFEYKGDTYLSLSKELTEIYESVNNRFEVDYEYIQDITEDEDSGVGAVAKAKIKNPDGLMAMIGILIGYYDTYYIYPIPGFDENYMLYMGEYVFVNENSLDRALKEYSPPDNYFYIASYYDGDEYTSKQAILLTDKIYDELSSNQEFLKQIERDSDNINENEKYTLPDPSEKFPFKTAQDLIIENVLIVGKSKDSLIIYDFVNVGLKDDNMYQDILIDVGGKGTGYLDVYLELSEEAKKIIKDIL